MNCTYTTVAVVGGGLAGLHASKLLHEHGIQFKLLEARGRWGGRILSVDENGSATDDGFDLGPSWFWPKMQPDLESLVRELDLAIFPQNDDGDVIFERMSREAPSRYSVTQQQQQSMRFAGGTGALINALVAKIPGDAVLINRSVKHMVLESDKTTLTMSNADGAEHALIVDQVIAAIPPRLLAKVSFEPSIDQATARRWQEAATWMAPHAKFFAVYDRPFWRDAGLSGTAQSFVGPLGEIHDATTASGKAALFGFPSIGADERAALGDEEFAKACLAQFARLYGPEALHPRATLLKDWAADPLTATEHDRSAGGHPAPSAATWVTGPWQQRLSLAGSETAAMEPGYMACAISASKRAVAEVMQRLRAQGESTTTI